MYYLLGPGGGGDHRRWSPVPVSPNRTLTMNTYRIVSRLAIAWSAAVAVVAYASGAEPANGPKTPLDEYVAKPDPTYEWKVVQTIPGDGVTTFVVDLKSQTWRAA